MPTPLNHACSGLPLLAGLLLAGCSPAVEDPWQGQRDTPRPAIHAPGMVLRPEADRFLDVFILALEPYRDGFYKVPGPVTRPAKADPREFRELQKQLYALNFEHGHGALLRLLPPNTHLYVAEPKGPLAGPAGLEREAFIEYLRQRCGWSAEDLARRVHYFPSKHPLTWLQDAGEILGHDREGRAVIRVDARGRPEYIDNIRALVQAYPKRFSLLETSGGVPAEGGDQELVWLPDGGLGLMVGRNRVDQYFRNVRDETFSEYQVTRELAEEARQAFSATFHGLPVFFLPYSVLLAPNLGSEELFHMDMVAVLLRNPRGTHAFVPTYRPDPADANYHKPLDPALVKACQAEFDQAAAQLKGMGYEVRRLPFADHPVRSPANVIKYLDRFTQRHTVFLAHYPYHLPLADPKNPARRLDAALDHLAGTLGYYEEQPSPDSHLAVQHALSAAWVAMASTGLSPNPDFQAQAAAFREAGYDVIAVPIYPGGGGGLHCMALR